jgi:hypothetical protein
VQAEHPRPSLRDRTGHPIYNRVGVVKRHFKRASGDPAVCERSRLWFCFSLRRRFWCCFCFLLIRPRLAFRILQWKTGSTNHLSGHLTSDHDSLFELPDFLGEARRPISPTMNYSFTRVAHGLPCMRTSCAYPAWLRSIQYIRTANFLAIATFATPLPRRNFSRW